MFRHTAILMTLLLGAALSGCSSRGERISESDYPYTGPPLEDTRNSDESRYRDGGSPTGGTSARYAVEPRRYRTGDTGYYGRWAYDHGRDPSYDYYLASEDWWDGYDYEDYELSGHGYDGYPADVAYFYDDLDPYGTWYEDDLYGWVWSPDYVAVDWQPYTYGHWIYTDWGWTWYSNDPWGSNTYHYGRWYCDASDRWLWIPDDVWAPAWVSWRYGGGYVGWAPLPPEASWTSTYGLRYADHVLLPSRWCFVPETRFTSTRLRTYVLPDTRIERVYRATRDVTRYSVVKGRPAERGLKPDLIERSTGRDIPKYKLVTRERGQRRDALRGRTLYAPMPVVSRDDARGSRRDVVRTRGKMERSDRVLARERSDRGVIDRGRSSERFDRGARGRQERLDRVREERPERDRAERAERGRTQRMERDRAQRFEREERVQRDRAERMERDRADRVQRDRAERVQRDRDERFQRDRAERARRDPADRIQRERDERDRAERDRWERMNRAREERRRGQQMEQVREERRQAEQAKHEQARWERASAEQPRQARGQQARQEQPREEQDRHAEARQVAQQQVRPEQPGREESRQPHQERARKGGQSNQTGDDADDERGSGRGRGRNR